MATYTITYDLTQPGRNYNDLYARIRSYPWAHISESSWAIVSQQTAEAVRDHLKQAIDNNDKLFVGTISAPAYWWGMDQQVSTWLQQNL